VISGAKMIMAAAIATKAMAFMTLPIAASCGNAIQMIAIFILATFVGSTPPLEKIERRTPIFSQVSQRTIPDVESCITNALSAEGVPSILRGNDGDKMIYSELATIPWFVIYLRTAPSGIQVEVRKRYAFSDKWRRQIIACL
jgi:hypothetical protein